MAEAQDVHAVHEPCFEFVLAALVHAARFELEQLWVEGAAIEDDLVRLGGGRLHWRADLLFARRLRTLRVHAFALGEPWCILPRLGPIHPCMYRRLARLRAATPTM